jgi:AcrR family transcriptional regulator
MPKTTFLNLDKKKKEKFLKNCFEEFAGLDYNTASISFIVQEMGIAKGSVYQYFENKKDLFFYLVDLAVEEREKYLITVKPEKFKNFFSWFNARMEQKLLFEKEKTLYNRFLQNFFLQRNDPDLKDKYLKVRNKEYSYLEKILQYFSSGLRKKIPIGPVAYLFMDLENHLSDFQEVSAGKKYAEKTKMARNKEVAKSFLEVLKKGVDKN